VLFFFFFSVVFQGVGIGGEYPLSATISSESAQSNQKRGKQVAMVFSTQGIGILLAPTIVLILLLLLGKYSFFFFFF
jgi:PHS family inorganic phosphate transporter-like MFS transporter